MLGVLITIGVLLLLGLLSGQNWRIRDVFVDTHIFTSICISIFMCIEKCEFIPILPISPNTMRFILVFSLSIFVTSFFGSEEPNSHYP